MYKITSFSRRLAIIPFRFYCSSVEQSVNKFQSIQTKDREPLVPKHPARSKIDPEKLPPRTKIDADTIALLERLSLVDCANREGIETLEEAIAFADQILQVDTAGIEPMVTVLEDIPLTVREDTVSEGNCREAILKNAVLTEEEYFVAPPGNIPLEAREDLLFEKEDKSSHKS